MRWFRRLRFATAAVFLAALVGQSVAFGQTNTCRTDPTVTLSNGYVLTMWANISTDISNVNSVNYVLHVPKGVTIKNITYDANGGVENIQLVADQSGTHYSDVSYVPHIPAHLQVTSVTYDQFASLESFCWVADQGGNRFEDDTTVTTNSPAGTVPVTAGASLSQGNNTFSASGTNGQTLAITWKS